MSSASGYAEPPTGLIAWTARLRMSFRDESDMILQLISLHQLDSVPEGVTRIEASVPRNLAIKDDLEPGPLELHSQRIQIVRQ
jgi:hypothetical protein